MEISTINNKKIYIEPRWIYLGVLLVAGFIVLIALIFGSFYTVDANEDGVIQRFGKYVRKTEPGLHFKLPFGIEKATMVPVKKISKEEFGFRTLEAGVRTRYARGTYDDESLMLTGDLNIADVEWIVQYRIKDPIKYLFAIREPEETLRDLSESVMRLVVGDKTVSDVLTIGRVEIAQAVEVKLQKLLDLYETGLHVVTVNLQDVNPPDEVKPAFNAVNEAKQEKEKTIHQAESQRNKVIPEAKGEAKRTIAKAEGYATKRINEAKGDANRFKAIWEEYRNAKEVTKRRLYLEMMEEVLPKIDEIYIIDSEQKGLVPFLQLGKRGITSEK